MEERFAVEHPRRRRAILAAVRRPRGQSLVRQLDAGPDAPLGRAAGVVLHDGGTVERRRADPARGRSGAIWVGTTDGLNRIATEGSTPFRRPRISTRRALSTGSTPWRRRWRRGSLGRNPGRPRAVTAGPFEPHRASALSSRSRSSRCCAPQTTGSGSAPQLEGSRAGGPRSRREGRFVPSDAAGRHRLRPARGPPGLGLGSDEGRSLRDPRRRRRVKHTRRRSSRCTSSS